MNYLGDFPVNGTVHLKWSSNDADGASVTRATNGTISVYIGSSTTQLTTGVTDTEDFDGLTGVHHVAIDLSSSGTYAAGSECQVVLSGSTIDGQTVNAVLGSFSIERAGGVLALLKGTNSLAQIRTDIAGVQTDTDNIQTRLPAALVGGRMDANVGAVANDAITAAGLASDVGSEIGTAVWATGTRSLTVLDEDSTSIDLDATIRGAVGLSSANLDTQLDALPTAVENATAVWGAGARTLTALDEDSTTIDLDATVRAAVGLAAANLDTQLGAIDANVDAILDDTGTSGVVVASASKTGYRLSATGVDDIFDESVETGATLRESVRGHNAALLGKASGLETTGVAFRNLADNKDVIVATVDSDGNRSAVTVDLTP